LKDLPPKIINDYYCSLSDVQKILYQKIDDKSLENIESFNKESVL
jgi:SNF2 family DNA or RNA helicase